MAAFLTSDIDGRDYDQFVRVLKIGPGEYYLVQRHHHLAALWKAAQEGWIPKDWLNFIPIEVIQYNLAYPPTLVRRILTQGVVLRWKDIVPIQ